MNMDDQIDNDTDRIHKQREQLERQRRKRWEQQREYTRQCKMKKLREKPMTCRDEIALRFWLMCVNDSGMAAERWRCTMERAYRFADQFIQVGEEV